MRIVMIQLNHRNRYNLTVVQKGDNEMSRIKNFLDYRVGFWAIDAKYLNRTEFYYSVQGEIAGIRSALHWIVDCTDSELREALQRLTNYRDMLDEWYYHA